MGSRKLQDEETGSHCLSSWLPSWSNISGAQARTEMTKKKKKKTQIPVYSQWCVRFRARYQQYTGGKSQAWMSVRRWKPCCFAHWQMTSRQTPGIFHKAPSFSSSLSLEEGNQLHLHILTFTLSSVHSLSHVSLQPHGLQQARLPCPSPTAGAYSNSCPPSRWCQPTISSSVIPFSCSSWTLSTFKDKN